MSVQEPVYIVSCKRTPIVSFLGSFSQFSGPKLASFAIKDCLQELNLNPEQIDEVILGQACQAGVGQNPARQASVFADLPVRIPCTTVNKVCSSGLKSIMFGAQSIQLGQNHVVVCGGFESMSNVPHLLKKFRKGNQLGHDQVLDSLMADGLQDAYNGNPMGFCAEKTAQDLNITRQQTDAYCIGSYNKTLSAIAQGFIQREIVPIQIQNQVIQEDDEPKKFKQDKIAKLKPVFVKENGTITAASASKLDDGACIIILASQFMVNKLNLRPLAKIISYADSEVAPVDFCLAPISATEKALERANKKLEDICYFEYNEAFSTTALAIQKVLKIPDDKLNVFGGAVSLGHPLGIVQRLINVLHTKNGNLGVAGICNGGGGSSAIVIEKVN